MPILGAYAGYVCLKQDEFVSVPSCLDPAETVSLVLNYITAYRMPLSEARQAHELLGKGGVIGKIVLLQHVSPFGQNAA